LSVCGHTHTRTRRGNLSPELVAPPCAHAMPSGGRGSARALMLCRLELVAPRVRSCYAVWSSWLRACACYRNTGVSCGQFLTPTGHTKVSRSVSSPCSHTCGKVGKIHNAGGAKHYPGVLGGGLQTNNLSQISHVATMSSPIPIETLRKLCMFLRLLLALLFSPAVGTALVACCWHCSFRLLLALLLTLFSPIPYAQNDRYSKVSPTTHAPNM
jgi:hypothetical protein